MAKQDQSTESEEQGPPPRRERATKLDPQDMESPERVYTGAYPAAEIAREQQEKERLERSRKKLDREAREREQRKKEREQRKKSKMRKAVADAAERARIEARKALLKDSERQTETPKIDSLLEDWENWDEEAAKRDHPFWNKFNGAPEWANCSKHEDPRAKRQKSEELSIENYKLAKGGNFAIAYEACPLCKEEMQHKIDLAYWRGWGIPTNLLEANFDNFEISHEWQKQIVADCFRFSEMDRGFLLLIGNTGTGKDHLSVAIAKRHSNCIVTTHNALVRGMRASYSDHTTDHFLAVHEKIPMLVISELGVSFGGRDEGILLYEILSYRYEERLKTILNSNLPLRSDDEDEQTLIDLLGERLYSRLSEAVWKTLRLYGDDYRQQKRKGYFDD